MTTSAKGNLKRNLVQQTEIEDSNGNCETGEKQLNLAILAVPRNHESEIVCILNMTSEASKSNPLQGTNTKNPGEKFNTHIKNFTSFMFFLQI